MMPHARLPAFADVTADPQQLLRATLTGWQTGTPASRLASTAADLIGVKQSLECYPGCQYYDQF